MAGQQQAGENAPGPFKRGLSRIISTGLSNRPHFLSAIPVQTGKIPDLPHRTVPQTLPVASFSDTFCETMILSHSSSCSFPLGGGHLDPWPCVTTQQRGQLAGNKKPNSLFTYLHNGDAPSITGEGLQFVPPQIRELISWDALFSFGCVCCCLFFCSELWAVSLRFGVTLVLGRKTYAGDARRVRCFS